MLINQNDEYDEEYYEDNVDWYTGDDRDELEESAHTVGPRPDDPELLDQFDGNLEDADASASHVYASDSNELLSHVKSAKGYSPLAGIGASETCKVSRQGQERQEERIDFSVRRFHILVHQEFCQKLPSRSEPPPPMYKKPTETGTARGGPHHAPRLPSCSAKFGIVHQNVPTKEKRLTCHLTNVHLVHVLWVVLYSTPCETVLTTSQEIVEEPEDLVAFSIKDLEDVVAVSIESLEGFRILDGGATKTVSGSTSVQPMTDQYEETTVETTSVGFTFAGSETAAASTDIWILHSEFPQGILMNVVSSESTTFLIGLDVIREYDLVTDYHFKNVYSHTMKCCYLPCAILSCSGDDAEQKRLRTALSVE